MQKIMEFEKIVNRLNFSKVSENDNLSVNES